MGLPLRLSTRVSIAILVVFYSLVTFAQSSTSPAKSDSPGPVAVTPESLQEAMVFESIQTKAIYQEDGSGVREVKAVVKALSQAGVQGLAVLTFAYTSADQAVEFDYVRVRKPDGTVVVTPDYNIQDMPAEVSRTAPMYSDVHEKHVTVKALGVGDTLEYLVRYRTIKPQVPGQFWFSYTFDKNVIAKDLQLVINVPAKKYVKVVSPDLTPQIKEQAGRKVYTWTTSNLERKDPEKKSLLTKTTKEKPEPAVQITTFHDWEELGHWYGELARSQVVVTPQIQAKAAELTKGLTSDDDKMRAIYDFVSIHYHYVSLSFGIGRYQPHPAEDVLENEYGDCKDKHTLLAALLKAAGYEAWPALINASNLKIDPSLPSPGQFDHVITAVPRAGKDMLWLDTTPGVAPFGMLLANLRDKQALVIPNSKPASLVTTPENPPFPSVQSFVVKGKLNAEGSFAGHIVVTALGDSGVIDRYVFQQYPAARWKELMQTISYGLGFSGDVSSVEVADLSEINKPFDFSYDYKRDDMGDWENRRFTAPLPPMGIESSALPETKPEQPFFLGAIGTISYRAEIELPSGYTAYIHLPKPVDLKEDFADFRSVYDVKLGVLTITRELVIKKANVTLPQWEKFQVFAKAISSDRDSWIVLSNGERPKNSNSSYSNPEANQLFREGYQALQSRDNNRAEEMFKRLIQLDPKYPYAHSNLGTAYLNLGNVTEGIAELRKEEELYPDEAYSYRTLARALAFRRENTEAKYQLHKLLVLEPKDREAVLLLGSILTKEKKYPEAIEVFSKGLEVAPESTALQVQLGFAYIRNGEKDKGLALLEKALKNETDKTRTNDQLNTVAYDLAELDTGLDVAAQYAEKSVSAQEAESLTADPSHDGLGNAALLSATWDTLGWVYFKQGKYEKALSYVRASWLLCQQAEVGDHLGQIYAKLGEKDEAAHAYQLAYFSIDKRATFAQNNPLLNNIRDHYQALMGKDADPGAYKVSSRDGEATPLDELSRMRAVKITKTHHANASGSFNIVFAPGKVEEVIQVDGDESLKALSDEIKAAKFNVEFPNSNPSKLVRRGIMSCGSPGCDLALVPASDSSLFGR
jgi:tetratricopeptide (TPR) repeat protein/transglutaminase-like putative cysteine protease